MRNFIVLGLISGAISGCVMLCFMHLPGNFMVSKVANYLSILIPVLSIIVPQYYHHQSHSKKKYLHLFITGWIGIIMWASIIIFIGPFLKTGILTKPELAAQLIGIGTVVSLVTAFLISFIKKRKTPSSGSLDDLDY